MSLKKSFNFIVKKTPEKINYKVVETLVLLNIAKYYHLKYYLMNNRKTKDFVINYTKKKYPSLPNFQKKQNNKNPIKNRGGNDIDKKENKNLEIKFKSNINININKKSYFLSLKSDFEESIRKNDNENINLLLNKSLIHFPSSIFSQKAIIDRIINSREIEKNINLLENSFLKLMQKEKSNIYISARLNNLLQISQNESIKRLANYYLHRKPNDTRILISLGDLAKQDGNISLAESYYSILTAYREHYAKAKLISLYTDFGLFTKGEEILQSLIKENITYQNKKNLLPMLLRVCHFYPAQKESIFILRDSFAKDIKINKKESRQEKITALMKIRHIPSLINDLNPGEKKSHHHVNLITSELGDIIRTAYENDLKTDEFLVIQNSQQRSIKKEDIAKSKKIIELFIPTVFFSMDDTKEIYNTIRTGYKNIIDILSKTDLILLPRMQYNWRKVDNLLKKNILCYHSILEKDLSGIVVQESTIPGRISIDHYGYAGFSSFSKIENLSNIDTTQKETIEKFIFNYKKEKTSKYPQNKKTATNQCNKNYIFIPLQVQTDSVSALRNFNIEDALAETYNFAIQHNLSILIKRHPYCKSEKISKIINNLVDDKNLFLVDNCIHELIENSKFVVTANSGCGLEALMYEKAVVTFGESDYNLAALQSKNINEFKNNLEIANSMTQKTNHDFLYKYIYEYTCNVFSEDEISKAIFKKII